MEAHHLTNVCTGQTESTKSIISIITRRKRKAAVMELKRKRATKRAKAKVTSNQSNLMQTTSMPTRPMPSTTILTMSSVRALDYIIESFVIYKEK